MQTESSLPPALPAYTVGAAFNAVRILRFLAASASPMRLTPIARGLDLHPSHCLNLLRTLSDAQLIRHEPQEKVYSIGTGLFELAQAAMASLESPLVVQPLLDSFSKRNELTVLLWRRISAESLMLVASAVHNEAFHITAGIGTRLPLLSGSMGHVIAGAGLLEDSELQRYFSERGSGPENSFEEFLENSQQARTIGWSLSRDDGWQGLSVRVPGPPGSTLRIVNAIMLQSKSRGDQLERLAEQLKNLAVGLAGIS